MEDKFFREYYGFAEDGWRPRMAGEPAEPEPQVKSQPQSQPQPQAEAQAHYQQPSQQQPVREAPLAPLIAVVGGSGGVGRTTLAFLAAHFAAAQGLDTVLVEGDLQFGDLSFWLGLDDSLPSLADPENCEPIRCAQGFDLYRAPVFPEAADEVEEALAANIKRIRANRGLVIVDTGDYWSGFTARLLLQCDLFLMLVDDRPASVAAAVKASELCARLGVPSTRMLAVYNRWSSKNAVSSRGVARALGADQICCVTNGRDEVDEALRTGDIPRLIEAENPVIAGVQEVLQAALPRVGCAFYPSEQRRRGVFK